MAQQSPIRAILIEKSIKDKQIVQKKSLVKNINFTNIGPLNYERVCG
jgi:hypothetical protein